MGTESYNGRVDLVDDTFRIPALGCYVDLWE